MSGTSPLRKVARGQGNRREIRDFCEQTSHGDQKISLEKPDHWIEDPEGCTPKRATTSDWLVEAELLGYLRMDLAESADHGFPTLRSAQRSTDSAMRRERRYCLLVTGPENPG